MNYTHNTSTQLCDKQGHKLQQHALGSCKTDTPKVTPNWPLPGAWCLPVVESGFPMRKSQAEPTYSGDELLQGHPRPIILVGYLHFCSAFMMSKITVTSSRLLVSWYVLSASKCKRVGTPRQHA